MALANGDAKNAAEFWCKAESFSDIPDYQKYLRIASRFDNIHDNGSGIPAYEMAVEYYNKAGASGDRPKGALDYAYHLAFLYEKLNCIQEAIASWKVVINGLASERGITKGETAEWPKREIERLHSVTT
jgi:tetratricopeptide (TPR) repeat protein